jgi:hypothetical protein
VKINSVTINRRRRCFELSISGRPLTFPFAKCDPRPSATDPISTAYVDPELGREAFTFTLKSGSEGSVHLDDILEDNKDPSYLRDLLVYQLTLQAQAHVAQTRLSKREIIRRLGTSAAQFYRLIDPTNTTKSIDQLLRLLNVLDCDVQFVVHSKCA